MPVRKPVDSFVARRYQAIVNAGFTFVLKRRTGSPQRLRIEDDDRGSSISFLSVLDLGEFRRDIGGYRIASISIRTTRCQPRLGQLDEQPQVV